MSPWKPLSSHYHNKEICFFYFLPISIYKSLKIFKFTWCGLSLFIHSLFNFLAIHPCNYNPNCKNCFLISCLRLLQCSYLCIFVNMFMYILYTLVYANMYEMHEWVCCCSIDSPSGNISHNTIQYMYVYQEK